ncbi:MAG: hypothetical protein LBS03_05155 [Bacteroidales bacterium]|jgi:phosphoribosylformylglycinamidine synthase|nr:hypothetical protein [Bacteroidales bacterium]
MDQLNQSFQNGKNNVFARAQEIAGRDFNRWERELMERLWENDTLTGTTSTTDSDQSPVVSETEKQAGIVELTEDYSCVFRTLPVDVSSAAEVEFAFGRAYQDLFVHGAQPLAALLTIALDDDAQPEQPEVKTMVTAIASPPNIYGIPVVGGDLCFRKTKEPCVDLFAVGIVDHALQLYPACNEGNKVYLLSDYGGKTGIFASRTTYELICDLHDEDLIKAMQAVGKNGALGACADMTANGNCGIALQAENMIDSPTDFPKLLQYEPDKVVIIINDDSRSKMERICRKWDKQWLLIGTVVDDNQLTVNYRQTVIAAWTGEILRTFIYDRMENETPNFPVHVPPHAPATFPKTDDCRNTALSLTRSPNLMSHRWFFDRFDSTIGTNNLSTNFISDAPALQIKGTRCAVAVAFVSGRFSPDDHAQAVSLLVAEAVRKTVCAGGNPLTVTGCLTLKDNDEKHRKDTAARICHALADACRQLGIAPPAINTVSIPSDKPCTNISVGCIAFMEDKHRQMTISFKGKGDMIYLLGKTSDRQHDSEYARVCCGIKDLLPPEMDMDAEAKLLQITKQAIARKLIKSAHSVTRGGLFMSLLESAMVREFGFDITADGEISKEAFLFGETPSRIVVSVATTREADFIDFMMTSNVPFMTLGHVTREEIRIDDNSFGFISDYRREVKTSEQLTIKN